MTLSHQSITCRLLTCLCLKERLLLLQLFCMSLIVFTVMMSHWLGVGYLLCPKLWQGCAMCLNLFWGKSDNPNISVWANVRDYGFILELYTIICPSLTTLSQRPSLPNLFCAPLFCLCLLPNLPQTPRRWRSPGLTVFLCTGCVHPIPLLGNIGYSPTAAV